jgi:hypothetical protein
VAMNVFQPRIRRRSTGLWYDDSENWMRTSITP